MNILKLKISKNKELVFLGLYEGNKVWQVIKKNKFNKNFWKCYFVLQNGKNCHRIISTKKNDLLTIHFRNILSIIALRLSHSINTLHYVGIFNNYHLWETRNLDNKSMFKPMFVFCNHASYIVIKERNLYNEIKNNITYVKVEA